MTAIISPINLRNVDGGQLSTHRKRLLLFVILLHATIPLGCHTAAFVFRHQHRTPTLLGFRFGEEEHDVKTTVKPTHNNANAQPKKRLFWQKAKGDAAKTNQDNTGKRGNSASNPSLFTFSEILDTEALLRTAKNMGDGTTSAAESLLKGVSDRMVELQASVELSSFLRQAKEIVSNSKSAGLDKAMNETRAYASGLLSIADDVLTKGYVTGDPLAGKEQRILQDIHSSNVATTENKGNKDANARSADNDPQALFGSFDSAVEMNDWTPFTEEMYKMANMASIIYYEESKALDELRTRGENMVATGTTCNIKWTITDSLARTSEHQHNQPRLVRTVTIRGFDASDETVDRQDLFRTICCSAQTETLQGLNQNVAVHAGLYKMAQQLYLELRRYLVDWLSHTDTQIVFVGHSIGGSVANLLLFLLAMDQGPDFVKERVRRVYTFGSPPVSELAPKQPRQVRSKTGKVTILAQDEEEELERTYHCDVLRAFGLPSTIVYGFVQPWDPICRLFTSFDPLYPLIGEIDLEIDDGMILWPRGPPRALRHVTAAIIDAWGEDWHAFRDEFRLNCNQTYSSIGTQHILMPEPTRYLTDRFISMDIAVPPVQTLLRVSSRDLLPALVKTFPLDTFEISYVPQAIRSFVHHFYPAYSGSLQDYMKRLRHSAETDADDLDQGLEQDAEEHPCFLLDDETLLAMLGNEDSSIIKAHAVSKTEGSGSSSSLNAHPSEHLPHHRQLKLRPWRRAAKWLGRSQD